MRLLLDEHIHPAVVTGVRIRSGIEIAALSVWQHGVYLGADDSVLLAAAHTEGWTLVSYDQRTIPSLLKDWGEQGIPHGGVIFVDDHTIDPQDIGGLIRALLNLIALSGALDWENRVEYLRRLP